MIELISIHIPKTGGNSFRATLKEVYGEDAVLNIHHVSKKIDKMRPLNIKPEDISPNIRVIHGHFNYSDLIKTYGFDKNIPVITWMRDPTERVISHYFYLKRELFDSLDKLDADEETYKFVNSISKNVIEYAWWSHRRNIMSRSLEGMALKSLFFIGFVENYTEDLKYLSEKLNWKEYQEYQHNTTQLIKKNPNRNKKRLIKLLNLKDLRLYRQAQRLRKKRS